MDSNRVLITMAEFEKVEKASKVLILLSGETPTYINVWYDTVQIRMRLSQMPNPIIVLALKHLSLVNQMYRKSSKSWHLRQCLIREFKDLNSEELNGVILNDLKLCDTCNAHDQRNYYNWTHR